MLNCSLIIPTKFHQLQQQQQTIIKFNPLLVEKKISNSFFLIVVRTKQKSF